MSSFSCSISNIQRRHNFLEVDACKSLKETQVSIKFLSETLQDYGTMPIFKRTFSQDLDLLEQHLTKDILSRTDCTTTLTDLRTKFENAFHSEFEEQTASNKLVKECSLNSETKDVHAIKYKMSKAKERCMAYFQSLHSHLQVLSKDDLKGLALELGFNRHSCHSLSVNIQMTDTYFVEYTGIEVKHFRDTLLQHMGNVKKSVAERTHAIRIDSTGQMNNSRSGNVTDVNDAEDISLFMTKSNG
ncbi:hypothetical protein Tco_0697758 [Tanacetum coccineum]